MSSNVSSFTIYTEMRVQMMVHLFHMLAKIQQKFNSESLSQPPSYEDV